MWRFQALDTEKGNFLAATSRKIGLAHVLYASDELAGDHHPPTAQHWNKMRRNLSLTQEEFRIIAANMAPYLADK